MKNYKTYLYIFISFIAVLATYWYLSSDKIIEPIEPPETFVKGKLLHAKGIRMSGVTLNFFPTDSKWAYDSFPQGLTDQNGNFELIFVYLGARTRRIPPGKYIVTAMFVETSKRAQISSDYAHPDKSTLRVEIPIEGTNNLEIKLD
jgi:hypothetical protein